MAKISGWTYLIIGAVVSLASYLINKRSGEFKLFLFFIIGIVFVVIGFFKIASGKKKKPVQKQNPVQRHPKIVFCPYCSQAVYETQKYCHRCRARLG